MLFAYCGTLGHSYDLTSTFDALSILQEKGIKYRFVIMGDGPLKSQFVEYARKKALMRSLQEHLIILIWFSAYVNVILH